MNQKRIVEKDQNIGWYNLYLMIYPADKQRTFDID